MEPEPLLDGPGLYGPSPPVLGPWGVESGLLCALVSLGDGLHYTASYGLNSIHQVLTKYLLRGKKPLSKSQRPWFQPHLTDQPSSILIPELWVAHLYHKLTRLGADIWTGGPLWLSDHTAQRACDCRLPQPHPGPSETRPLPPWILSQTLPPLLCAFSGHRVQLFGREANITGVLHTSDALYTCLNLQPVGDSEPWSSTNVRILSGSDSACNGTDWQLPWSSPPLCLTAPCASLLQLAER